LKPLLQIEALTVTFNGGRAAALDRLSLAMAPGEAVGVLGESGCGKTTLALAILGALPANEVQVNGSIRWDEEEIIQAPADELRALRGDRVALIPQEPALALHPTLRVGEQIADVVAAHRPWRRQRCREEAKTWLQHAGFEDSVERVFDFYPHQLSGGQRQRVAIAQAICCQPELLIADEPTTALDTITQAEILALLRRLRREFGMALLMISHDPTVLAETVERVIVMQTGRIVESGAASVVLENPAHPYSRALLQSALRRAA
jgi:peptide/nickel transport system ATP-binding protein